MNPSERYARLVEKTTGKLRENLGMETPAQFTELELQAHWFAGDFGTEFTSINGERIRIAQFGAWNREAGPDFADAAISIDGKRAVRGAIEIDPDAQDWERHGHATNPEYDGVVLHICTRDAGRRFFTRTSRHREIPRIRLDPHRVDGPVADSQPIAKPGRCCAAMRNLGPDKLREVLEGAAQFRLRRKAARLARIAGLHGEDEALYQALAIALGYKNNKLPFTVLAQRFPLAVLQRRKEDLDALLFGSAGFLDDSDFTAFDMETRAYLRNLWELWWKLRSQFSPLILAANLWRLASVRPANHPQRRIAALAEIVRHWPKLSALVKDGEISMIRSFLESLGDEYWDFHYTLTSRKSARRMALVGEGRINDILANVIYPLVISTHPDRWKDYIKLPAPMVSRPVKIAALRLLGGHQQAGKTLIKKAACQQGLLQIYEDFCMRDSTGCAQCPFPEQVAKW
jgi:hypothetical protein